MSDFSLDHGDHDYNSSRHLFDWLLREGEICPNTVGPTRMTACEKCVYDSGEHAEWCEVPAKHDAHVLEMLSMSDDNGFTLPRVPNAVKYRLR